MYIGVCCNYYAENDSLPTAKLCSFLKIENMRKKWFRVQPKDNKFLHNAFKKQNFIYNVVIFNYTYKFITYCFYFILTIFEKKTNLISEI